MAIRIQYVEPSGEQDSIVQKFNTEHDLAMYLNLLQTLGCTNIWYMYIH